MLLNPQRRDLLVTIKKTRAHSSDFWQLWASLRFISAFPLNRGRFFLGNMKHEVVWPFWIQSGLCWEIWFPLEAILKLLNYLIPTLRRSTLSYMPSLWSQPSPKKGVLFHGIKLCFSIYYLTNNSVISTLSHLNRNTNSAEITGWDHRFNTCLVSSWFHHHKLEVESSGNLLHWSKLLELCTVAFGTTLACTEVVH